MRESGYIDVVKHLLYSIPQIYTFTWFVKVKGWTMPNRKGESQSVFVALAFFTLMMVLILFSSFLVIDSPSLCNQCHQMKKEYSTWKKPPHSQASCTNCHSFSGRSGWIMFRLKRCQMLISYLLGNYTQPITAKVKNANCLSCHQDVQEKTLVKRTIRVSHKEFLKEGDRCTDCHNTITHKQQVPRKKYPHMEKCTPCHNGDTASKSCSLCHTEQESPKPRYGMGPWAVTHSDKWAKTHGMGNLSTCIVCHPQDYCVRCHQTELPHPEEAWEATHGKRALSMGEICNSCHFLNYCSSCHQTAMPHPDGWLPIHGKESEGLGKKNCIRCHIEYDCDDCHEKHIHRAIKHQREER